MNTNTKIIVNNFVKEKKKKRKKEKMKNGKN